MTKRQWEALLTRACDHLSVTGVYGHMLHCEGCRWAYRPPRRGEDAVNWIAWQVEAHYR